MEEIRLVQEEEEEEEKGEEEGEEKKKAGNRAWVMAAGAVATIITNSWDCQKMGTPAVSLKPGKP